MHICESYLHVYVAYRTITPCIYVRVIPLLYYETVSYILVLVIFACTSINHRKSVYLFILAYLKFAVTI